MFAALAMSVAILGWILHGSGTITNAWLDPVSITLLAIALIAAHMALGNRIPRQ